jgi:hypothetical protein
MLSSSTCPTCAQGLGELAADPGLAVLTAAWLLARVVQAEVGRARWC